MLDAKIGSESNAMDVKSNASKDDGIEQETEEELRRSIDKPTIDSILYNPTVESDVPTPGNLADVEEEDPRQPVMSPTPSTPGTLKRKEGEDDGESTSTKPSTKKSRKLQGAGVKKPLYTRYESIFIIKAFKAITDKIPNLVLIDLFKIIAILFNEEAKRQGFKERTSDQLYQKYKRIQHGLNHGELEFTDFFERNKYNPKEWIPNFSKVEKTDEILKYIKFQKLDDAIKEILGSSVANLKPPLPDSYEDAEDERIDDSREPNPNKNSNNFNDHSTVNTELASTKFKNDDAEDELLKLAGYDESEPAISAAAALTSLDPSKSKPIAQTDLTIIQDLRQKLHHAHQEVTRQREVIKILEQNVAMKNQECQFLKSMIKEDLSYIRHKLNETQSHSNYRSAVSSHFNTVSSHQHHNSSQQSSNEPQQAQKQPTPILPSLQPHVHHTHSLSQSYLNLESINHHSNQISGTQMVPTSSTASVINLQPAVDDSKENVSMEPPFPIQLEPNVKSEGS